MNSRRYLFFIILVFSLLALVSCSPSEKKGPDSSPVSSGTLEANMQESGTVPPEQTKEGNAIKTPELKWNKKKNTPVKTTSYGFVTASLDDIVYVLVLESPNVYLYRYDPQTDTWSDRFPLKSQMSEIHTATALNGKIYHYGGLDINHEESDLIEEFDPSANTSRIIEDDNERKSIMEAIKGSLLLEDVTPPGGPDTWKYGPYFINGREFVLVTEPGAWINHIYEFDSEKRAWVKKAKMPADRADPSIQVMGDRIITLGGWKDGSVLSDAIEIYDPATDTWTEAGKLPQPMWCMASAYINGKLYLIGGKTTGWADETGGYTDTVTELEIDFDP